MKLVLFIILAFSILFPLVWSMTVYACHTLSGLRALARRYPLEEATWAKGLQKVGPRSAIIGWVNYSHILISGIIDQFFVLKVVRLFSIGFKGIQVPLREIHYDGEKRWVFVTYRCYRVGDTQMRFLRKDDPFDGVSPALQSSSTSREL